MSVGPRHQLNKHFESKHVIMEASSDLGKSLFFLNRLCGRKMESCAIQTRRCERVVAALNLQHAKTVVTQAARES